MFIRETSDIDYIEVFSNLLGNVQFILVNFQISNLSLCMVGTKLRKYYAMGKDQIAVAFP